MNEVKERGNIIIGALKECVSKEDIEDTFNKYDIPELLQRVDYLNGAMGNPQTFFSSEDIQPETLYEITISMFVAGSWKLAALYEKAGF
ncbi:MAG: hypothetical protein LBC53_07750 [Spirochaetaceae bacterium]|jgi:pyruvate carboxylase|nr:hypothetical protein [Spirochaetaceae bacterium]